MPVREILLLGNPFLWQPCQNVTNIRSSEIQGMIDDLAATLADFRSRKGFGRAIAAPQIGEHRRLIFVEMSDGAQPMVLINPSIVRASREMIELWDDCFSFPELLVRVRRHLEIVVRYMDEHASQKEITLRGDHSELLQHEIDHLDGILATDRAIDARSFAMRSVVK
ncbi:MAG TPA: peptide deformylase [Blastocatellia bacterium]|nr:peptide deformylase [Blastocatellia bacterium]